MSSEQLVHEYEQAISRIILHCVAELPFPLGIKKTVSLLRGAKSTFVINHGLHTIDTYSVFSTFTGKALRTIIETLVKTELLEVEFVSEYQNLPVLRVTSKGRDFISGKYSANIGFVADFIDRNIPELNDFEKGLFEELRKVRREIAKERDIPAFMVCGDVVLRELTLRKPSDTPSLLTVRGIGEKLAESCGQEFLETISAYVRDTTLPENE